MATPLQPPPSSTFSRRKTVNESSEKINNVFDYFFRLVDAKGQGIVTGEQVVTFWKRSNLPQSILSQIWALADSKGKGSLTRDEFELGLKLIALAQDGQPLDTNVAINYSAPRIDGIIVPPMLNRSGSLSNANLNVLPGGGIPFKEEEKTNFSQIFFKLNPNQGVLDANSCRSVFVKSNLPTDVLGRVWNLVDRQKKGSLSQDEFVAAMIVLGRLVDGTLKQVPTVFPTLLVTNTPSSSVPASNLTTAPLAPVPSPMTAVVSSPLPSDWTISTEDKQKYGLMFETLDKDKQGFLPGPEVVKTLKQSKLSPSVLGQIWNLTDVNKNGKFSKDAFVAAMFLVQKAIANVPMPASFPVISASPLSYPPSNSLPSPSPLNASSVEALRQHVKEMDHKSGLKEAELIDATNKTNALAAEMDSLTKRKEEAEASFLKASQELQMELERQLVIKTRSAEGEQLIFSYQSECKEKTLQLEELKSQRSAMLDDSIKQEALIADLKAQLERLNAESAKLTKEIEEANTTAKQHKELIEQFQQTLTLKRKENVELENQLSKSKSAVTSNFEELKRISQITTESAQMLPKSAVDSPQMLSKSATESPQMFSSSKSSPIRKQESDFKTFTAPSSPEKGNAWTNDFFKPKEVSVFENDLSQPVFDAFSPNQKQSKDHSTDVFQSPNSDAFQTPTDDIFQSPKYENLGPLKHESKLAVDFKADSNDAFKYNNAEDLFKSPVNDPFKYNNAEDLFKSPVGNSFNDNKEFSNNNYNFNEIGNFSQLKVENVAIRQSPIPSIDSIPFGKDSKQKKDIQSQVVKDSPKADSKETFDQFSPMSVKSEPLKKEEFDLSNDSPGSTKSDPFMSFAAKETPVSTSDPFSSDPFGNQTKNGFFDSNVEPSFGGNLGNDFFDNRAESSFGGNQKAANDFFDNKAESGFGGNQKAANDFFDNKPESNFTAGTVASKSNTSDGISPKAKSNNEAFENVPKLGSRASSPLKSKLIEEHDMFASEFADFDAPSVPIDVLNASPTAFMSSTKPEFSPNFESFEYGNPFGTDFKSTAVDNNNFFADPFNATETGKHEIDSIFGASGSPVPVPSYDPFGASFTDQINDSPKEKEEPKAVTDPKLKSLVDMGFDQQKAATALKNCDGNITDAMNLLLNE